MSLRPRSDKRQGILPYVLKAAEQGEVTGRAGLPLVVESVRALGLDELASKALPRPKRESGFSPARKLEALITLIAAGGDRVEDIRVLAEDKGLETLLGGPFPSPDALLDFLGQFHDPKAVDAKPSDKKAFVPKESPALKALDDINREVVHRGAAASATVATIDHDGTIIEAHKRDALIAYEGTRGYQPLVAVWAEQQLILADEFRDGNVAGGEDPLSSAQRALENLPASVKERRFRADSASYYTPLLKYLVKEEVAFAISADMSQELRLVCEGVANWKPLDTREREQVDHAEVEFTPGEWPKDADPLRYIALRFTPLQNDLFEPRGIRFHAVVSNRKDLDPEGIVRWHREKAGTIEHVHRALKDELGAGVMPSTRFGVNAAWFRINVLTYNVLSVLRQHALPERFSHARPKRLRFEIFVLPGRLTTHQSQLIVQASASDARLEEIITARGRLLNFRDARLSKGP